MLTWVAYRERQHLRWIAGYNHAAGDLLRSDSVDDTIAILKEESRHEMTFGTGKRTAFELGILSALARWSKQA